MRGALRLAAVLIAAVLSSCGGGGGSGGGGNGGGGSGGAPVIQATLIAFPGTAVPPGFVNGNHNAGVQVAVLNAATNAPISSATVTFNGVALTYVPADGQYEGAFDINPGATVQVRVVTGGSTYTASRQNFSTYPTIVTPAANATWSTQASNLVTWSGAAPTSTSQYAIAVLDTSGNLVWPAGNSMMLVPSSATETMVGQGEVSAGDRLVLVGIVDIVEIAGAANDSGFIVGGFDYAPITVVAPVVAPQSLAVSPASVTVGIGRSAQLTATATLTDNTTLDVTTQSTWTSSDAAKATISSTGQVSGVAGGRVTVTAHYGGFASGTSVTVFVPDPTPTPAISQSVTYHIDVAHTGHATVGASGPVFPPTAHWSITLSGDRISYPLIAGGKVFVTTNQPPPGAGYGTTLYAIDEQTGQIAWGPTPIEGLYAISGIAYDHGKVFVVNFDGVLRAFDAASGTLLWSGQFPGVYYVDSAPTALDGIVYLVGGGVSAIDEKDGNLLWTAPGGGSHTSPALSADGLFVANPCYALKMDPLLGTALWFYSEPCSGGGGKTVAYSGNVAYVRQMLDMNPTTVVNVKLNATNGVRLGTFDSIYIPAFSGTTGFFATASGTLKAIDTASGTTLWSFEGDGHLITAPIVIDDVVVTGSSLGVVYALDVVNGNILWSDTAGAPIDGPDEHNAMLLTGFGAGDGYLVVPAGNVLNGWRLIP
ncbi:MAG: PQQ-binding-like beta-propeller repeat protein [Steroidobacteraceae bacterium]